MARVTRLRSNMSASLCSAIFVAYSTII
ncbi:hypothetical protein CFP56_030162 [Quercus suber]|uniref:Uncharacterized protein n=1 Tax=Quercus suber TaxID=58331 RepID=A0AAW0LWU9_QUESU